MINNLGRWLSANLHALRDGLGAFLAIFFVVVIGVITLGNEAEKAMRGQLGERLTSSAQSLARLVDPKLFNSLTKAEDENSEAYRQLYSKIHDFGLRNPAFRFTYTCLSKGDSVYFAVDGSAPGDADNDKVEDHASLFDHYPDASENLLQVLKHGGFGYDKQPYTDSWGTFQSGCAEIHDKEKGVVGAACVDMNLSSYNAKFRQIYRAEILILISSLVIALGIGLSVFLLRKKQIFFQNRLLLLSQEQEQMNLILIESQTQLIESQRQAGLGHWTYYVATKELKWSAEMYRIHARDPILGPPSLADGINSAHPDDRQLVLDQMEHVLNKGQLTEMSHRMVLPDGTLRYMFTRIKPELDDTGKVWLIKVITQDMTRWHAIEAQLTQARDRAEMAAKAKSEFLAMMSHEIRTPMNGVLGMAHILKDSSLTPDQNILLNTLLESGEHLLTLINDILDFSKIEAGRMEMERIPFDLKMLSISVCDILREKANNAKSSLTVGYKLNDGEQYLGDPGRIRQILFNLIGNSVKFTKSGDIKLDIENGKDHPGFISIAVEDTGIGMTATQVENLFQPFSQANTSTARKYGGTGLGLAITFKLVDLMRGTLSVKSSLNNGTRFQVLLPLAKVEGDSGESESPDSGFIIPNLNGLRVLLVDDRDSSRIVVRRQLESLHMQVFEAVSATNARDIIADLTQKNLLPHVGIIDWCVDVESGMEFGKSLRAQNNTPEFPLILISYAAAGGDSKKAREAGFDGFLVKPVPIEIFAAAIYLSGKKSELPKNSFITQHVIREMGWKFGVSSPSSLSHESVEIPAKPQLDWSAYKPRILLAEDNLVNQKVAIRMLERMGCQVTLAENGVEALNMGLKESYDLVLMDCMMPEMDGYEATIAIRVREKPTGRHLPIVACTANANPEEIQRSIDCGMDDFLTKPYKPDKLKEMVEKWAFTDRSPKG